MGSGDVVVGLYLRDELFTVSYNWPALGGAVTPGSAGQSIKVSEIQETKDLVKTESFIYYCLLAVSESASFQASALPLKCICAEVDA